MKRRYSQQTQQIMITPSIGQKRKHSQRSNNSDVSTSCSQQQPKRRKLTKKDVDDSPFFTQPPIANISNISPIRNKNENDNNGSQINEDCFSPISDNHDKRNNISDNKISTSDLAFLQQNADIFTPYHLEPEPPDFNPIESPMLCRTLFKSNEKKEEKHPESKSNKNDDDDDDEDEHGIPNRFLNLDNITWANLVSRECDKAEQQNMNLDDILTPELTPQTMSQMLSID